MGIFKKLQIKKEQGEYLTAEERRYIALSSPWREKKYKIENGHVVEDLEEFENQVNKNK